MNRQKVIARRDLFRFAASTAASFPLVVSGAAVAAGTPPSDKIGLGVIGFGPRGSFDLRCFLKLEDVRCLAVCDVQANRRKAGKAFVDSYYNNRDCATYRDFRKLLARDDIDALLIATGDRWHALASITAAEAGKDVYCEKPCGLTISYCQQLADTFTRTRRVFQAGTQRRSVPNFQRAVKLAQSGKLGKIHTLYASVYTPRVLTQWLPGEPTPPKEVVDWNLWLGPAPWRLYNKRYVQGGWRGYWDFDSGATLLDWGAHTVDLCQWANNSDDTMPIRYEPSKKNVVAYYKNGVKLVLDFLKTPFGKRPGWVQELGTCPVRFVGEEGWVETGDSGEIVVQPPSLKKEIGRYEKTSGLDVVAHARNFINCVYSRKLPAANQHVMRHSHIACHAAALSWLLNRPLELDPIKEEFLNDDEANSLRSRPARDPWNF